MIPAYTCIVVPNAIMASGNHPRLVDIRLEDFTMDIDKLQSALSENTRVVIPTEMFGYPVDVRRVVDLLEDFKRRDGTLVVEDACLGLRTRDVGRNSDAVFYSFNVGKQIVTLDGGMVTTNDEDLMTRLREFRSQYFSHKALNDSKKLLQLWASYFAFRDEIYGILYELWSTFDTIRVRSKNWSLAGNGMPKDFAHALTKTQAKIGLSQLKKIDGIIERRVDIAREYDRRLEELAGIVKPPLRYGATYSHYTIRLKHRNDFERRMALRGIHVGRTFDYSIGEVLRSSAGGMECEVFANSLRAANEVVNLPIHPSLSDNEINHVCNTVEEWCIEG